MVRKQFLILIFLISFTNLFSADTQSRKLKLLELERGIDKILANVDQNVHVGVEVISLDSGLRLYERDAKKLFVPSSNIKIFVAGAALTYLGPEFTFETRLSTDGSIVQKSLRGNLYLKGSGDPSFTFADLERLVLELRLRQIEEIQGDLIVDHFDFDDYHQGPGWMWDDVNGVSYSPMSALCVNHNCIDLWVAPAEKAALPPKVFAFPKTSFVSIQNGAVTDEKTQNLKVQRTLTGKQNAIQLTGEISLRDEIQFFRVPIKNPHLYAATLLQALLKKAGIELKGKLRQDQTPPHSKILATHHSASLSLLLAQMMKQTDNLYADTIFKKVGQVHFQETGNWKNGSLAVREHLQEDANLEIKDLVILDGSGLSRYNLASPRHVTQYLQWAYKNFEYAPELLSAFALAGKEGTLKNRFTEKPIYLRGKTGTMTGLTSLSGYLRTEDGEMLTFSIMINGFTEKTARYKTEIEEPICYLLANYSK